jgi:xylan 1,4-beta-xylosidase
LQVFSTYDFLLSIGMRPIVELSFMPQALASNVSETVFHYEGGISPPNDWNVWSTFIQGFVQALVDRYGLAEVSQWLFEVWVSHVLLA